MDVSHFNQPAPKGTPHGRVEELHSVGFMPLGEPGRDYRQMLHMDVMFDLAYRNR